MTIPGRYGPFAELLRRDGYVVRSLRSPFRRAALADAQVLVIANALAEVNVDDWSLPNPSAFSDDEIEVIVSWVREGGALLLIADHQPWPAAAARLAGRFGLLFYNGYTDRLQFRRESGALQDHPITRGRGLAEQIDFVMDGKVVDVAFSNYKNPIPSFYSYQSIPTELEISPRLLVEGAGPTTMRVRGNAMWPFHRVMLKREFGSIFNLNSIELPTLFVSRNELQATIAPEMITEPGTYTITIKSEGEVLPESHRAHLIVGFRE